MTSKPVEYDWDPNNLPPKLLEAIGLGMASAAQTEWAVDMAIWSCLGLDVEFGWATTAHMAMPLKFSVLRSALEIRLDDLKVIDELDEVIDEVEKALEKRNAFAHQRWAIVKETGKLLACRVDARSSLLPTQTERDAAQINDEAKEIYQAGLKLIRFLVEHDLAPKIPAFRPRGHKMRKVRREARKKARGVNE